MDDILGEMQAARHRCLAQYVHAARLGEMYEDRLLSLRFDRAMLDKLSEMDHLVLDEALRVMTEGGLRW